MDLEYLASIGVLDFESSPLRPDAVPELDTARAVPKFDSDAELDQDDDALFSSGDVTVPSVLKSAFFQVDFSLTSLAPPNFAACVLALDSHCLPLSQECLEIDDMDISTVTEVLSIFCDLQQLERRSFLRAADLPPMLRNVPPAAALCRVFAMAQVHRCRAHLRHSSPEEFVCSYFDAMCEDLQISAGDFKGLYTLTEVLPSVYSLHTDSRLVLGSTFLRFQEYYECPNPKIRHSACKFDEYKTWYIQEHPKSGFDYYLQWPGFNIPSWVLDDARIGKLGLPLRPQESAFLSAVPANARYIIGSCEKDLQTLQHELAHGLYGTNPNYRKAVAQSLAKLPSKRWEASRRVLLHLGYPDDKEILEDEMQAYMIEGNCLYEVGETECPLAGQVRSEIYQSFSDMAGKAVQAAADTHHSV